MTWYDVLMEERELSNALMNKGSDFDSKLVRLIADGDSVNRGRLRRGFPELVARVEKRLKLKRGKPLVEIFASDERG